MRNLSMIALFVSLFFLIGFPMIFMVISMFTDQWIYLFSGSVPSALAGMAGIVLLLQNAKKHEQDEGQFVEESASETISQ